MTDQDQEAVGLILARFSRHERPRWIARASSLLSAAELGRAAAIVDPDTRAQHAIGRALIRLLAARALGGSPREVSVAETDTGKPWLPEVPELHVNVSHTRRTVVVASSWSAPVGVDVEQPAARAVHPRRLAQRLFARSEVSMLGPLPEDRLAERFSSVWTIKEAVGKALGVGVVPALSQVVVEARDDRLELASVGSGPPAATWTLHQLTAPGGSEKIAVALPVPGIPLAPVSVLTLDGFARAVEAQNLPVWPGEDPRARAAGRSGEEQNLAAGSGEDPRARAVERSGASGGGRASRAASTGPATERAHDHGATARR